MDAFGPSTLDVTPYTVMKLEGAPLPTNAVPTSHPSARVTSPGSMLVAGLGVHMREPLAFFTLANFPIWDWLWGGHAEMGFGPMLPLAIQSRSEPT